MPTNPEDISGGQPEAAGQRGVRAPAGIARAAAPHASPEPCPECGYDLRGHPVHTRCPECGRWVCPSEARWETSRWIDARLLDLWSIALLEGVAIVAGLLSLVALHEGQFAAVGLGMAALLFTFVATVWYAGILMSLAVKFRRPTIRHHNRRHRRKLLRWVAADGVLIVAWPGLFLLACSFLP